MKEVVLPQGSLGRMLVDGLIVAVSLGGAMVVYLLWTSLHADGIVAAGGFSNLWRQSVQTYAVSLAMLLPLSLGLFRLGGFYTYGRAYRSRYKALLIFYACSLSFLIYATAAYLIPPIPQLPRTVWILAWISTTAGMIGARLWASVWTRTAREEERLLRQLDLSRPAKVLVIGGAGYIGAVLIRRLLERGYRVRLLDALVYGDGPIKDLYSNPRFEFIKGDFRSVESVVHAVQDVDAVIHLGAIVGDPACSLDRELTVEINLAATRMIAEIAKGNGIQRFVFASTCSVYGASDGQLDEESPLNPVSLYAETKIASEGVLLRMADAHFCPVILRLGTIHGMAPRPRFDLVVNLFAARAAVEGKISIFGGDQWRPFVHVADAAEAFIKAVEAPAAVVRGQVYNVGSNDQNYTINDVAAMVREVLPETEVEIRGQDSDRRNYWVRFDKIARDLGFKARYTVRQGIEEVVEAVRSGRITDYQSPMYNNYKFLSDDSVLATMRLRDSIFSFAGVGQSLTSLTEAAATSERAS